MRWIPPLRIGAPTAPASRGACLLAGLTFLCHVTIAEDDAYVSVTESAVTIEVENMSIRNILELISEEADIVVHSDSVLDERITVSLDSTSIIDAVARILRSESYILLITGNTFDDRLTTRGHLWIFSGQHDQETKGWSAQPANDASATSENEWNRNQLLANSGDKVDREKAMFRLGENHRGSGIELLRQGLSDSSREVRQAAIESLADIGGNESVLALGIALADSDTGLRISAIDALGEIGGKESERLIQKAMADADSRVREAAGDWVVELNWRR